MVWCADGLRCSCPLRELPLTESMFRKQQHSFPHKGRISSKAARIHLDSCKDFCENLWILLHLICVYYIFLDKNQLGFSQLYWRESLQEWILVKIPPFPHIPLSPDADPLFVFDLGGGSNVGGDIGDAPDDQHWGFNTPPFSSGDESTVWWCEPGMACGADFWCGDAAWGKWMNGEKMI